MIFGVAVANILKVEVAIESDEPASEAEKELGEGGMHVEIVLA
jgi:hypothetical protein